MKTSHLTRCFALALVLLLGVAAGCIRSEQEEFVARGGILTLVSGKVKVANEVVYTVGEQSYSITPQGEGTTLALVKVRVINQKSTQVTLSLDGEAAILMSPGGEEFKPLDPSRIAVATSRAAPEGNPYGSHLWGQIQLLQGYEITGWFFFEVPVGSKFIALSWEDVESIIVNY